jgi:RHS repeat-associated protein
MLETPAAKAQRASSLMAFHGLGAPEARTLLLHDYGSLLAGASTSPAASVATMGRVVRYVNDYRAVVRTPHGLQFVESTVPLRVASGSGAKRPVDLRLVATGGAFVPLTPLKRVSIADSSAGGVAVGTDGLRVTMEGQDVPGSMTGEKSVFFGDVGRDMDAVAAPKLDGAELFAVLRSRMSPEHIRYRVTLPAGAVLQASGDGAVVLSKDGDALARIPAPTALDAQGVSVPVQMRVVGSELLLTVLHRKLDVAYPLLVDPEVTNISESSDWAFSYTPSFRFCGEPAKMNGKTGPISVEVPTTSFPLPEYARCEESPPRSYEYVEGGWGLTSSSPIGPAEFYGVSFSGEAVGSSEPGEDLEWFLNDCDDSMPGNLNLPPSRTVVIDPHPGCHDYSVGIGLIAGELRKSEAVTVKGSLSVEAVLITGPITPVPASKTWGQANPAEPNSINCRIGKPVNCATGDETETQTDLDVGGRGPKLGMTRTYNSQLAVAQGEHSEHGPFGYGWTGSYSAHLTFGEACGGPSCVEVVTVDQDNGSTVQFEKPHEEYVATGPLVQATLAKEGSEYVYRLPSQATLRFNGSGQLLSETDPNGNTLTMKYDSKKNLESITDSAGRKITLAYNSEGLMESATDPMGYTVKYTYEGANLATVIEPGEAKPRWQFKYNSEHELTSMTDGREHATTTEYDSSHRVISQTDPLERKRKWEYAGTFGQENTFTTITEPNASVTREEFNAAGLPTSVTHAYGTSGAATTTYKYDIYSNLTSSTDPDGHITKYTYDSAGDRTGEVSPDGDEAKWTYNSSHQIETTTTPSGETTTITRNSHGNPETISRPAPGEKTQTTTYKYDSHQDLESVTDPLGRTIKYEYDSNGDRTAEIDPEGNKRTWTYNEDSQETSTVSPRGNVEGADPTLFRTSVERDAQGRALTVIEPESKSASAPTDRTPAVVSGMALEGSTLSAGTGVWEGSPSLSYSYQWQACNAAGGECFNVPGLTEPTVYLSSEGVGYTLRVVVTASNSAGSASSTSAATAVVSVSAPAVFSSAFGSSGSGSGQFAQPEGIAVDPHGDVWVTDAYNSRVEKFSGSGSWLATYGKLGMGNGEYFEPVGIAMNQGTGDVYIVDQYADKVQELNEDGEWVRSWEGHEGAFDEPSGIAVDAHGNVWVADYGNDRVEEFNEKGEFLLKLGSAGSEGGKFLGPAGLLVANGYVYVTDFNSARLEAFTEEGSYVGEVGGWGIGIGAFVYPDGLAANSSGDVYVVELGNDRVQELTPYGSFLSLFGSAGSGTGQLAEPHDLAVSSTGALYITDSENDRVEKWVPAGTPVNSVPASVSGEIRIGQTLSANTGVWSAAPAPTYSYQWQRCNSSGESCSSVSGSTEATYVLGSGDIGHSFRVVVTATNSGGSSASTSAATEVMGRGRTTQYSYDADGNLESVTDPEGNKTTYTYDADNEPVKVEEPDGTITETGYDNAGKVTSQTDGDKHTTKYVRNGLEEVTEVKDPLGHKTTKEYDHDGNLTSLTDPAGHTTTYKYDPASRPTEVKYSDGKTPTVKYVYDEDGHRTSMTDGTGTTSYTYDQLGRLTEAKDGHGDTTKYEYDLANEQTKITYPNGKSIIRSYDEAGRLEKVTDWLEHTTKFQYDPDGDLIATIFPSETTNEDKYAYSDADTMSEVKMLKGSETLASLAYSRDNDGQVTATTSKSLPGSESTESAYDPNSRLTKAGSVAYEYDAANNPTKVGAGTYKYNNASQLETGPSTTYAYNELGERTKTTPSTGPATTYSYDEAGDLTAVERPKEGETPKIEDAYGYNGEGLQANQTITGTTSYLTWDPTEGLPMVLNDGTNSYIYGPGGMPIEQISSGGTVIYLHHDQAGSTRLITGSSGTVEGKCTYSAYGTPTCEGSATTPLGYDGQYTNNDTGLVYLRARVYDPATAQFLTVDPLEAISGEPYGYAGDSPLTYGDSLGLIWLPLPGGAGGADAACGATFEIPGVDVGTCGAAAIASGAAAIGSAVGVFTAVAGEESGDEGEAELKAKEAERENCGNPTTPPSEDGWEWRGKGPVGSKEGAWFNPDTRESLHPDLDNEDHGPHYDYKAPDGSRWRIYPDGRIEPQE